MRKHPSSSTTNIQEVYPKWLYKRCNKCGLLIKKEWMYKVFYQGLYNGVHAEFINYYLYYCKDCAPTPSAAMDLRKQHAVKNNSG